MRGAFDRCPRVSCQVLLPLLVEKEILPQQYLGVELLTAGASAENRDNARGRPGIPELIARCQEDER